MQYEMVSFSLRKFNHNNGRFWRIKTARLLDNSIFEMQAMFNIWILETSELVCLAVRFIILQLSLHSLFRNFACYFDDLRIWKSDIFEKKSSKSTDSKFLLISRCVTFFFNLSRQVYYVVLLSMKIIRRQWNYHIWTSEFEIPNAGRNLNNEFNFCKLNKLNNRCTIWKG